jgi:hypothetical protein
MGTPNFTSTLRNATFAPVFSRTFKVGVPEVKASFIVPMNRSYAQ